MVIDYRADDKYTESAAEKLNEIEQIFHVESFNEGVYFLVRSLNDSVWVSSKIMYQRYPNLTFSFYESITTMNISKPESTTVSYDQLLKMSDPKNMNDTNFITAFKTNINSKQRIEAEYALNEQKLRHQHEKLLLTVKKELQDYYEKENKELELKVSLLYEESRLLLKSSFQDEINDYFQPMVEVSDESIDMDIFDVDIDDEVYSQSNPNWEFDEPENDDFY